MLPASVWDSAVRKVSPPAPPPPSPPPHTESWGGAPPPPARAVRGDKGRRRPPLPPDRRRRLAAILVGSHPPGPPPPPRRGLVFFGERGTQSRKHKVWCRGAGGAQPPASQGWREVHMGFGFNLGNTAYLSEPRTEYTYTKHSAITRGGRMNRMNMFNNVLLVIICALYTLPIIMSYVVFVRHMT